MTEVWLTALEGNPRLPLYQVGPYGSWGDLQWSFRWGAGACGMYEASWTMPLPPDFEHPLLRRGSLVEVMDGPWRMGSPLILSEPAKGSSLSDPWQFTATGVGREVEGDSAFYAFDGGGSVTTKCATAVDAAIARGLRWSGYDATVPAGDFGTAGEPQTLGSLLNAYGDSVNQRWRVYRDNLLSFSGDPTTPSYQIVPGAAALGTADDDYATVVYVRYADSTSGTNLTVHSPASTSPTESRFGRRETLVNLTEDRPSMSAAAAQAIADGILAKYKGRLAWSNALTGLTSNDILTMGGVPADLSKVAEDVGDGCMVRLHGIWSDLLEYNGQTYLDVVIGEAKYADGSPTIDLSPLGLAPRDLAAVIESVTLLAAS